MVEEVEKQDQEKGWRTNLPPRTLRLKFEISGMEVEQLVFTHSTTHQVTYALCRWPVESLEVSGKPNPVCHGPASHAKDVYDKFCQHWNLQ